MKERPILMNAFSVRAILDGRKTQTRRVIKPQPYGYAPTEGIEPGTWLWVEAGDHGYGEPVRCPHGAPGDRLLVRETAYISPADFCRRADATHFDYEGRPRMVGYVASMSNDAMRCAEDYGVKKTPSIHMPLWASRLTLEIIDIRVEPVRHISAHDAICEGIVPGGYMGDPCDVADAAVDEFQMLWDSINGGGDFSWERNPWVWVIAFEVVND